MPRNEAKPLSESDALAQRLNLNTLAPALRDGATVSLEYVKRDGSSSSSTGVPTFVNGRPGMDTGSITLDTPDKGARTINLHRITRIIIL